MKKRLLSLTLALAICIVGFAVTAFVEDSPVISDLKVVYDESEEQCWLTFNLTNKDSTYDALYGRRYYGLHL